MEDFLNCLSCGKTLGDKERNHYNYCAECILKLDFRLEKLNREEIDQNLQKILDFFVSDVSAAFNKDPAAQSLLEVLTSYPGIKAILLHRIAHFFWKIKMPFVPRYLSEVTRELTGIEIHPGAEIGQFRGAVVAHLPRLHRGRPGAGHRGERGGGGLRHRLQSSHLGCAGKPVYP